MKQLKYILSALITSTLLGSCATHDTVAKNDVYVQQPSLLAVGEDNDQNDMTSYNAYKAGRSGIFQTYYPTLGAGSHFHPQTFYSAGFHFQPFYDPFYGQHYNPLIHNPFYYNPLTFQNYHGHGWNSWYSPYGNHFMGIHHMNTFAIHNNVNTHNYINTFSRHRGTFRTNSGREIRQNSINSQTSYSPQQKQQMISNKGAVTSEQVRKNQRVSASSNVNTNGATTNRSVRKAEYVRPGQRGVSSTTINNTRANARATNNQRSRNINPSRDVRSRTATRTSSSTYHPSPGARRSNTVTRGEAQRSTGSRNSGIRSSSRGTQFNSTGSRSNRMSPGTTRSTGGSMSRGSSGTRSGGRR